MTLRATARLQFNSGFTLDDAVAIVPYLADVGVSHIYASPIFAARAGSGHGYDIVDPARINPALGGMAALERLSVALKNRGMGLIIDIVPNHMAASHENPWWFDVLEWGVKSHFSHFFDINWHPPDPQLRRKVLLPILGGALADAVERGDIKLIYHPDQRRLVFSYFDRLLPLAAEGYQDVFKQLAGPFQPFASSEPPQPITPAAFTDIVDRLATLYAAQGDELNSALAQFNDAGRQKIFALLERQHYVVSPWTEAATRINWRRFFDISDLIALRMDRHEVYRATHVRVLDLMEAGMIDGVRLDHVDGLADPKAYCRRLHRDLSRAVTKGQASLSPYVVVEKILATGEQLPTDWSVSGTTGYDFMAQVSAVLHQPLGEDTLTKLWAEVAPKDADFAEVSAEARRETLAALFPRAFEDLTDLFLATSSERATSQARARIARGLELLLVAFTRYRLYGDANGLSSDDVGELERCAHRAMANHDEADRQAVEIICKLIMKASARERRSLAALLRFQQLSATLTAKAIEDTAFYRYGRLLSRNEVGSDPAQFALSVEQFHAANQLRQRAFPHAMLATATHDHKRGEDVRCRLAVISEDAEHWSALVREWLALHEPERVIVSTRDQLMIYQTIIGAWPLELQPADQAGLKIFATRLERWLIKALREAKRATSWINPDLNYEEACCHFLQMALDPVQTGKFLGEAHAYVRRIAASAALNGLSQTTLKLACPGIPDLYQGCDLWDFSLVDPDNRAPVDFGKRQAFLRETHPLPALLANWQDGRIKQRLLQILLQIRQEKDEIFSRGYYLPLAVSGPRASQLICFARQDTSGYLIAAVPRLTFSALQDKEDLVLPAAYWRGTAVHLPQKLRPAVFRNVFTGEELTLDKGIVQAEQLLELFPICLLVQAETNRGPERKGDGSEGRTDTSARA